MSFPPLGPATSSRPEDIRVLFVEDTPEDAELEERELRKAGFTVVSKRVETSQGIVDSLKDFNPSLIISDYSLPKLNGLEALKIVRGLRPEIPFIFVSGTIGEERAIESLKNGATDYVVKDRPASFVSKVRRALAEQEERKRRLLLEEQFRQAQKMEAIGRLAGGVAHDFNNLLTVINGYTELIIAQLPSEHPIRRDLEEVLGAGHRASGLTRQLLAFSRKQVIQPSVLDLNAVTTNLQKMLTRLVGEDIQLVLELDPSVPRVFADAGQIEQVVMNLVVNARDAMPDGGRLRIRTAGGTLEKIASTRFPDAKPGPCTVIEITDAGTGIPPDVLEHLFEPFFTTKEQGKGTGLGLSTVHGIVSQAGGAIEVESEPGKGSTFRILLPKATQVGAVEASPSAVTTSGRGNETVLIAEDEESVRRLVCGILESAGFRVLSARGGVEALKIAEDQEGRIDLLISDVVMKSMNGPELAKLLRRIHPETRILFMSGYTDREHAGIVVEDNSSFLHKPFSVEVLKAKVREVLGAP